MERILTLGSIAGPHGLKGWVRVISHTDPREAIFSYHPWLLGENQQAVEILDGGRSGKSLVVHLEGVNDREAAEALNGKAIGVYRSQLPELEDKEFYWADLIGLEVVLPEGRSLGKIEQMMATGANDVMVVEGDRQRLIPFVIDQTVVEVDTESGKVIVDWDADF